MYRKVSLPVAAAFLAVFCLAAPASARQFRVQEIPNGAQFSCNSCHTQVALTPFGNHVGRTLTGRGDVDWQAVYDSDDDGDGYTNGEELGDPNGTWQYGDPDPAGPAFNPGYANSNPCGDGQLEGPEECDGSNLDGQDCASVGEGSGTLACTSQCHFDVSGCQTTTNNNNGTNNGTNTDNGTNTNTDNGTNTNTDNGASTDNGSTTTDNGSGTTSNDGSNQTGSNANGDNSDDSPVVIIYSDNATGNDSACSVTAMSGAAPSTPLLAVLGLLALDGLFEATRRRS